MLCQLASIKRKFHLDLNLYFNRQDIRGQRAATFRDQCYDEVIKMERDFFAPMS